MLCLVPHTPDFQGGDVWRKIIEFNWILLPINYWVGPELF